MIVEQRRYTLVPGQTGEYLRKYEEIGLAIQRPILGDLIGYFSTDIGELNQIVHLWGYASMEERSKRRAQLKGSEEWVKYTASIRPLILTQRNEILIPAPFSPVGNGR